MRIIGISTSPRPGSNSETALKNTLNAAKEEGADTQLYNFRELDVMPCEGDNFCRRNNGACFIKDDMSKILYNAIIDADKIIIASPIFVSDICSQAKAFIDRFYAFSSSPNFLKLKDKEISMIITQTTPVADAFKTTLEAKMDSLAAFNFQKGELLILSNVTKPGEILYRSDLISKAKEMGRKLVNE